MFAALPAVLDSLGTAERNFRQPQTNITSSLFLQRLSLVPGVNPSQGPLVIPLYVVTAIPQNMSSTKHHPQSRMLLV
jgi:hypothetical protein